MSGDGQNKSRNRMFPALLIGGGSYYVLERGGPMLYWHGINYITAGASFFLLLAFFAFTADLFTLLGKFFTWWQARTPQGIKGKAAFVKSLREIKGDLTPLKLGPSWGPYWGLFTKRRWLFFKKRTAIFSDFASNALTIGPAGSGKGIGAVLPAIMSIRESKWLVDFKGEITCVVKEALEKRDEIFRFINIGGMWRDILGEGDCYNPLENIIAKDFIRNGGLHDVTADLTEMSHQLYPDPPQEGGDDQFWRDGSRDLIAFACLLVVLSKGKRGNLGDVVQLLANRKQLLNDALWMAGRLVHMKPKQDADDDELKREKVPAPPMPIADSPWAKLHPEQDVETFIRHARGWAGRIADLLLEPDPKTAESFLTGARQALSSFNITTRAHKCLSRSTFSFSDMKEGEQATNVAVIIDSTRLESQKKILGLLQWCAMQEIKRHENKKRPVYFIADEGTNFKIHDLPSLLTWGRGYGLKLHLIIQSVSSFVSVYGQEAFNTLMSETEIKQFLPGQREPDTLDMLEKMMGQASIMSKNNSGNREQGSFAIDSYGYAEDSMTVMTADEIRRTDKTILFIRRNRAVLVDLPAIAAIAPFRGQIGINPFHGKPFLQRVTLRLLRRDGILPVRLMVGLIARFKSRKSPYRSKGTRP